MTAPRFRGLQSGHYGAILADPPWRFATWSAQGRGRSPDGPHEGGAPRHYATMTIPEIIALPVRDLAAPDCALFLWCLDHMIPEALLVGRRWGFVYRTVAFTWAKSRPPAPQRAGLPIQDDAHWHLGNGYWTRANPEMCLLFTRGTPKRQDASVRRLLVAERRDHSQKPVCVRTRIERLVGGPYCELFARERAIGWDAWGDQLPEAP